MFWSGWSHGRRCTSLFRLNHYCTYKLCYAEPEKDLAFVFLHGSITCLIESCNSVNTTFRFTFSLISFFLRVAFSCEVRGLVGSSSVVEKLPSTTGTGLLREDPPPDDTSKRNVGRKSLCYGSWNVSNNEWHLEHVREVKHKRKLLNGTSIQYHYWILQFHVPSIILMRNSCR